MLEKEYIQSRGFRNVSVDGVKTGFQFALRLNYYRGIWLSQLRPATVTCDGEVFSGDQIAWTIGDNTYKQSELQDLSDVHWNVQNTAVLTIRKPGGLPSGIHDIEVTYSYSSSYMPPHMDEVLSRLTPSKRRMVLVR
jgi:hypothetical protein